MATGIVSVAEVGVSGAGNSGIAVGVGGESVGLLQLLEIGLVLIVRFRLRAEAVVVV